MKSKANIPVTVYKSTAMENETNSIESLIDSTRSYIETRVDLLKLKAIDKSSSFISALITYLAVFIIIFCFFILLNIGLALLIGNLLGKAYYGFFILAFLYAVIGMVLFKNRKKWIKTPVINLMVKEMLD
jgi:Putative Actinobacterial Holin-X, holin superfamily III